MKKYPWALASTIYLLTAVFLLYEMALQVSPSIMMHQLMSAFDVGAKLLGFAVSFYFYSYTLMQIPVGLLYDRFGPRVLISSAVLLCALGSLSFGLSGDLFFLSLGRFFMGFGSAFAFVGVLVIATRWFPAYLFAFLVGVAQLLAAIGAIGGELPLAYLVNHFGWRAVMIGSSGVGVLLAVLCLTVVRNHPFSHENVVMHKHDLIKDLKSIFRSKQTWWIALYAFSGWGPITVFAALWAVPFFMEKYQITNTKAALASGMMWLGVGLMSPFIGWLSDRIRRRKILTQLTSLLGFISSIFAIFVPGVPFWLNLFFLFCIGLAASGQILTFALVKDNNRHTVMATAIGFNNMAVVVGGALLQPLVGYILHLNWDGKMFYDIAVYSVQNYQAGLIIVPICFLVGLFVSTFRIQETYCRAHYDDYSDVVS